MRKRPVLLLSFAVILLGITGRLSYAQQGPPPDRIEIVTFNYHTWPVIPFSFLLYCNNNKTYEYDALRIYEDGKQIFPTVKYCGDAYYMGNLGIIIDRSGSQETQLNGIKEGLVRFIESYLQGQAFIASFAELATIDQPLTSNETALTDAVKMLRSKGLTVLWEGVEVALDACTQDVRDVVLITDGAINGGGNVAFRAVDKAQSMYTRLHVLSIGSVSPAKDTLKMVAAETGGRFMHLPKGFYPDEFVASMGLWFNLRQFKDSACAYQYQTSCADGRRREVIFEIDACGKTLTDVVYYNAPLDPKLPTLTIEVGDDRLYYGQTAEIPVRITDIWQPNVVNFLDLTINVPEEFEILGVTTEGCALESVPGVDISIVPPVVRVRATADVGINPIVTELFKIQVSVSEEVEKEANVELDITRHNMILDQCALYKTKSGLLDGIKKGVPIISCDADSIYVGWNIEESKYEPEILELRVNVNNPTPIAVNNAYVTVTVPPGLELLDGPATRPVGNGSLLSAEQLVFRVRPLITDYPKSFEVCFEAGGDSTEATQCCTRIYLEGATPYLETWCEIPDSVAWDADRAAYVPEDFPVSVFVKNKGKIPARNIELAIKLPESCMLRSWYREVVPLSPAELLPGETGRYTWKVVPMARFSDMQVDIVTTVSVLEEIQEQLCSIFVPAGYPRINLVCGNAKSLYYNDTTKKYSPDLFAVSAEVENTSRLPIWYVRAELSLPPFLHFQPGDGPVKALDMDPLWPGVKRTVYWLLYAEGPPIDSAKVCMKVWAPDLPADSCCIPINTRNTMLPLPELYCSLDMPETIVFTDNGYDPNPFIVDVSVVNLGDTAAGMVYVALHQGAELSIDPSDDALKLLDPELGVTESATAHFLLNVLDRNVSRWDTVRISVYSENGGAVLCEKRIWIEGVRAPLLSLQCSGPDSLVFDDATLSYQPSPFYVYLTATNTGTAPADSVVAEYLAGNNMELVAGETAAKMLSPSYLDVTESGTAQWAVKALPRTIATMDTIYLQATSRQRLLEEVIPCPVTVYVPPVRAPELKLTCEPPSLVTVEGHRYLPDPLTFRLLIQSTGTAVAYDVRAEAEYSSRLLLASGDTKVKTLQSMPALQGSREFTWDFHPVPSTLGDTVVVTFRVVGRHLQEQFCIVKLYLPPVPPAVGNTEITCAGPDTVRGDEQLRLYPNPIRISTMLENTGFGDIDTLIATVHPPSGMELADGEPGSRTVTDFQAGEVRSIDWYLNVIEDTSTVLKERTIRVRIVSQNELRYCDVPIVVVPFSSEGRYAFGTSCSAPDTIRYDIEQRTLAPGIFPVRATIRNTGAVALSDVVAVLSYPGRFLLADGESVQKQLGAPLQPGDSASFKWLCTPVLRPVTGTAACTIAVTATSAEPASCKTTTVVEGYTPGVTVEVASGNVVGFEQTIRVPVTITNPAAESFTEFRHTIGFDTRAVSLTDVHIAGSLTEYWSIPTHTESGAGLVEVYCSGDAPVIGSGVLYYLVFTGVSDGYYSPFDVISSTIDISGADSINGAAVTYIPGDITTSGSCVVPLEAGQGYGLEQNNPNPFNPVTTISYHIPQLKQPVEAVLEILDIYGRVVHRYEEGRRSGGTYSLQFDATGMQSGMYFYRLRAGHYIATRKMMYMK